MSRRLAALSPPSSPAPAAAGHGRGGARLHLDAHAGDAGLGGLTVQVLQGDDQLQLRQRQGREVVIEGYEGEPYLRFDAGGGVYRNASPATYLNRNGSAAPRARHRLEEPRRIGSGSHREDLRLARPPHPLDEHDRPGEGADRSEPHHVFDWTVPGSVGGRRSRSREASTTGRRLASSFNPILIAPLVALALGGGVYWWARRRREADASG